MTEPMRIVELRAENFKRLQAVEIRPDADGNLVVISGRNGAGKTSTLDAIWAALGGGSAARDTPRPIRDGAETAEVSLDLGKIRVTRRWTAKGTSLVVSSPEGAEYRSPQALLDGLVGKLSFDPLAFAQQPAKAQLATLLDLVDLPFDPDELAETRREIFDRRTAVNRDLANLQARIAGMPQIDADHLPDEEVATADLMAEFRDAQSKHNEAGRMQFEIQAASNEVEHRRRLLEEAQAAFDAAQATLSALPRPPAVDELPDLADIDRRIAGVGETNRLIRTAAERRGLEADATGTLELSKRLTEEIRDLDQQKADALQKAQMPIDGLGFDDDGVTYRGVPFGQCSAAEKLRVSVAMAMALNPRVRVIRITDGSLLDSDNLRLIEEMAADRDFQIWIERVDDTGQVGIVIEDGVVAGASERSED